ncbi:MAG TPA: M20/M25/M40 family metallo-hydrolase [Trueperaceae bacterium]|nr:M20/M25/M40 family metallo-hydrolase [Trueperaceae bacterium]
MTDALDAARLLRDVVACPSPSGEEAAVARLLVERMQGFADEAFVDDAGNAVGVWGDGPLRVTVLGHIDTVPGMIAVREEGGELYGRGSVDAKGSFCAAVAAVAGLPAELRGRLRLRLIGAVEEEAPSSKGARYAVRAYEPPDVLVIGEPSGWDAYTLGYKGRLVARVEAARANAHSSRDEATAAEAVVDAVARVRAFVEADNAGAELAAADRAGDDTGVGTGTFRARFDALQLSLQELATENDGLTQRCGATLSFRLPPRWPPDVLQERLRALELPAGSGLSFTGSEAAVRFGRDSLVARAFRVAIRGAGGRPRSKVKTGTSDMNVVAPYWPAPTLAYGPGDSALDHTPDERLGLEEYARAVTVWRAALTELAGAAPA